MSSSTELTRCLTGVAALMLVSLLQAAEDPRELAERARHNAEQVKLDVQPAQFDDMERVRQGAAVATERARAELEQQAAARRARTNVNVSISEHGLQVNVPPDAATEGKGDAAALAGRLVVAVSSSMPEQMLRDYARQLDGVPEAILVLRGFIGGAREVKPTGQWIERVLRKHPADPDGGHYRVEVVVDPLAFRMLGINRVPAVTFLPGVQDLRHCDAETLSAVRIAYGAVSVAGALQALAPAVVVPAALRQRLGGAR